MATFIKLPDGTITNATRISEVSAFVKSYATCYDRLDDGTMPQVKSGIKVVFSDTREQEFLFADEAKRDAELLRLESLLVPGLTVVFPHLTVDGNSIQVVYFYWKRGEWLSHTLVASIKVSGAKPYLIDVTSDLMEQAESLASRFGVTIPPVPKLLGNWTEDVSSLPNPEDYPQ